MSRGNNMVMIGLAIVAVLAIGAIFFLAASLNTDEQPVADIVARDEAAPAPIVGAMPGPPQTDATDSDVASAATAAFDPADVRPGDGVRIVVGNDGRVRLYSDATHHALVMDILADGEQLSVLEPSGDYETYPVENDESQWVRVRAGNGLAGWVDAGALVGIE